MICVRPLIRQPLADNASHSGFRPFHVFDTKGRAVAVAEVIFSRITVQVLLGAMLVNATHTALEYAVIAFNRVGVDFTTAILAFGVDHKRVRVFAV